MMWMSLHPGRSFEEKSGAKHLEKKRRRVEKLMKNLPFSLTSNQKTTNNNVKQNYFTQQQQQEQEQLKTMLSNSTRRAALKSGGDIGKFSHALRSINLFLVGADTTGSSSLTSSSSSSCKYSSSSQNHYSTRNIGGGLRKGVLGGTTTTNFSPSSFLNHHHRNYNNNNNNNNRSRGEKRRQFSTKVTLPDLPYDFSALEPIIDAQIMEIHHSKHHNTYVTNLNVTLEKLAEAEAKNDVAAMIALQPNLKFNGGGHENHSLFWKVLQPKKEYSDPSGELKRMIERDFGSFENMKQKFASQTVAVQGSGWGWLGLNKETKTLHVVTTANQDPCITTGLVPVFGVDVWEHAYYLQYKNLRPDYVNKVWEIVNWKQVEENLVKALM
jgi:Fe-Mn family superoxide dismutase